MMMDGCVVMLLQCNYFGGIRGVKATVCGSCWPPAEPRRIVMDKITHPEGVVAGSKNPAELALEIYNILLPHHSEVRVRAIQSAMTALGEGGVKNRTGGLSGSMTSVDGPEEFADLKLGPKALKWVQKHGVTRAI